MHTEEIPTHEWIPFLDEFSRRHQGERVTVQILRSDTGPVTEAAHQPLLGVTVDMKDQSEQVEVIVGDSPDTNLMHAIGRPAHIRVAQDDGNNAERALQIESEDGTTTLVHLEGED